MKVRAVYYPKNMPTKIVVELPDGHHYITNLAPYRQVTDVELEPLACWTPAMGDPVGSYVLPFYGLEVLR